MKKIFLLALFIIAAGAVTSEAQTRRSFSAATGARGENVQQRRAPEPVRRGEIGAIPRAVRGGNPVQMLNPAAPRRYFGAPQDTVTAEPYFNRERYTGHTVTGIIVVGVVW
jgi:hypothetical protein